MNDYYKIYKKNNIYDISPDKYKLFDNKLKIIDGDKLFINKNDFNLNNNDYLVVEIYKNNNLFKSAIVEPNQIDYVNYDNKYLINCCFSLFDINNNEYLKDNNLRNNKSFDIKSIKLFDIAKEVTVIELKLEQYNILNNFVAFDPIRRILFNTCDLHNNLNKLLNKLIMYKDEYMSSFKNSYPVDSIDNLINIIKQYKEYNHYNDNKCERGL